jgi:hypothetical protein
LLPDVSKQQLSGRKRRDQTGAFLGKRSGADEKRGILPYIGKEKRIHYPQALSIFIHTLWR